MRRVNRNSTRDPFREEMHAIFSGLCPLSSDDNDPWVRLTRRQWMLHGAEWMANQERQGEGAAMLSRFGPPRGFDED